MNPHPLTELFSAVVSLSWRAGWLILVLAALRLAVRGRVPAQIWFAAWIVVAVRLLLPFSFPAEWSPYNLTAAAVVPEPSPAVVSPVVERPPVAAPIETAVSLPPIFAVPVAATAASALPPAEIAAPAWSHAEIFAGIWLTGVAVLAVARLAGSWSFRRQLRDARPVADGRVVTLVADELARAGRRARFALLETGAVDAPALYGLVRPRLLLPPGLAAKLTDDELRHVVRHELGHWRRRDLLAQALMQAAVVLHWFNPLAWLAARLARADCELACDEFVLRREAPGGATAYGATLLKVLGVLRGRRRPAAVVAMLENKEQLTQRIRMIAGYRAVTVGRVVAGVALIGALAAASLTRESRAQEKAGPANEAPSAAVSTPPAQPPKSNEAQPSTPPPSAAPPGANSYTGVTTISGGTLTISPTTLAAEVDAKAKAEAEKKARVDQAMKIYEALKVPADEQRRKVERLAQELHAYKQQSGAVSLDSRKDIVNETLKALNLEATRTGQQFNLAENRLNQIKERRSRGTGLLDLPFVANHPLVAPLQQQRASLQTRKELLADRYLEQHPIVKSVANEIAVTDAALERAIDTACRQLEAEHQEFVRQLDKVKKDLATRQAESVRLDDLALDYTRLERELKNNEAILQNLQVWSFEEVRAAATTPEPSATDSLTANPAGQGGTAGTPASREFTVSVIGAVNQQGGIRFAEQDKPIMLDVIARSGGFAPRADRNAVRVIRLNPDGSRSTHTLTEQELMSGIDPIGVLRRGDVVVVRETPEPGQVYVVGQVNSPGQFSMKAGSKLTLVEAVARAGGPTRLANMKKVVLKRTNPDGTKKVVMIDLEAIMKTDIQESWPLEPGDVISVPERTI